jgi:hypothetical protein
MNIVLTEAGEPSLRYVIGALLARAHSADFAIANIRLAHVDIGAADIENVRMRILLGRFEAMSTGDSALAERMEGLAALIRAGVVQVRSAGVGTWLPDFSIYRLETHANPRVACLVGAHYFGAPPCSGPALTSVHTDALSVGTVTARFNELWEMGHDVGPVIAHAMARMSGAGA